jgi:hypothetical protein
LAISRKASLLKLLAKQVKKMKQRKMKKGASALTLEFAPDSNKFLCPDVEVDPAEVVQVGASN